MELCEEMKKLRQWLSDNDIVWFDRSTIMSEEKIDYLMHLCGEIERAYFDTSIYRTHFIIKGELWSVINGFGTYGGFEPFENKNYGMLELRIGDNDPTGWLSADDITKMINGANNETT